MNPIILPPAIVEQIAFISFGEATSLGEGKLWFKPVKLRLKIDLVSYPAQVEGLVNMIKSFLKVVNRDDFRHTINYISMNAFLFYNAYSTH